MGFLDKLLSRGKKEAVEQQEKVLGVCIPEAHKKIMEQEAEERKQEEEKKTKLEERMRVLELPGFADEKPRLVVDGIFAVVDTLMIKGRVASGKIEKGMTIGIDKKKFKVKDLQFQGRSVPHLLKGQQGAVFFGKGKGLTFKAGAVLEFKNK